MKNLGKYSLGIGDRFGQQGIAQLKALQMAMDDGIEITPVWNKSNREHSIIHTDPEDTRYAADKAVREAGWKKDYFVDADHINLGTVDRFIDHSDFFTIDVAEFIGKPCSNEEIRKFISENQKYTGKLSIPGIPGKFEVSNDFLEKFASKFLAATIEAAKIYHYIEAKKGSGKFITEVSMDEVNEAQTPLELFFILSSLGSLEVPAQTIAPKFTGRFNKGIDYEGDIKIFGREFEEDLLVLDYAVKEFQLPADLKLSIHSGSDKFSIYPEIGSLLKKHNKGIHIKTAGTTWLEEVIGLSLSGKEALFIAKSIYTKAYNRRHELCTPYSTVIDIREEKLPLPEEVETWTAREFAETLRHIPGNPLYNPSFRQLIHVGYKIAAEYSNVYISLINQYRETVGKEVTENIYNRHILRLFEFLKK